MLHNHGGDILLCSQISPTLSGMNYTGHRNWWWGLGRHTGIVPTMLTIMKI
jgi:hypothetical protein